MIEKIKELLKDVSTEVENDRVKKVLKGEAFNLFSILNIETSENRTHSAFIGELLNPEGSHNLGNAFLKLFLDEVFDDSEAKIDVTTAVLTLEKGIGKVDLKNEEGGRVDIYLNDMDGKTISIENKINAREQNLQVKRKKHCYLFNKVWRR